MASPESAFRYADDPLIHSPDETASQTLGAETFGCPAPQAQIISLQAYKAVQMLKQLSSTESLYRAERLVPLINEAHVRPVRFYRGLEEWLLSHTQSDEQSSS